MQKAKLPLDEALRLSDLDAFEILDTAPETEFNDLAELLKQITGCSYVAISFIDSHRQWHKASLGLNSDSHARDISFCSHTILDKKVMVVPDASKDNRFFDSPLVKDDLRIRFYAGVSIVSTNGHNIGAVCAFDSRLHEFTPQQERAIEIISGQVTKLLELRLHNRKSMRKAEELIEMERKTLEYTIQAQEAERKSIGIELHENFAQVIAACLMYLSLAQETEELNKPLLNKAQQELMQLLKEMRSLSHSYNPISLPVVSLEEVVSEFLQHYAGSGKVKIKHDWEDKRIDLPGDVALNILRIMDGYLRLIRECGEWENVHIHITAQDDILLQISDDNLNDNIRTEKFNIGLNAILSRIEMLEGHYSIQREAGKPQCFKVRFPLGMEISE